MHFVFTLLVLVSLGVGSIEADAADDFRQMVKTVSDKCIAESGATEDAFQKLYVNGQAPTTHIEDCYAACALREVGAYFDNKFSVEVLDTLSAQRWTAPEDAEKARKIDALCVGQVKDGLDACAAAHDMITCFYGEAAKVGLKPAS